MFCRFATTAVLAVMLLSILTVAATANDHPLTTQSLSQMPLAFTKNMGQWDDRVLFRASSGGATMWFTKEGVTYEFTRRIDKLGGSVAATGLDSPIRGKDSKPDSTEQLVLSAKFLGGNPNPEVVAEGQMEYKCNFFLGNEPTKWHTDVPNYESIVLKDVYTGIDVRYSDGGSGQAAYEFVVAPGADMSQIKVTYEGVEGTSIDADGRMVVTTKWGDMIAALESPANGVLSGTGSFSQLSGKTIGFEAEGATGQALGTQTVVLTYSTYLGGGSGASGYRIAVDASGNAYVTGSAGSNFPTQNPYQATSPGAQDAFVTKLSGSGNSLIYSTYLGGGSSDEGCGIAVDGSGNAYVTGWTTSGNFPTIRAYQYYQGAQDVFVTKLSSSGNSLIYSTYLGGWTDDFGYGIAVDVGGNAYVTGWTKSSNFPTQNPYQTYQGGYDVFITKLSPSANPGPIYLIYSTYLGGGGNEGGDIATLSGGAIVVNWSGNAYVTGYTSSTNFPTLNAYQTDQGGWDAFVTELSSSGNSLIYSTYLGGGGDDYGYGIAINASGNAFVTGYTSSSNFPTLNSYQTYQGGCDAFVTKLSSAGNSLIYSTYLGGGSSDEGYGIAVDGSGNAYVTGWTYSSNFPIHNPYQATKHGVFDAFVTKLSTAGSSLVLSTYLGGADQDQGNSIAVDGSGYAYVTGYTSSSNFPTQNPYQATLQGGNCNAFVTKLSGAQYLCGDANGSGYIDISDATYLNAYIFSGGPAPNPLAAGDADCGGYIDISDVTYLIAYIFSGGPRPCASCK